MLEGFSNKLVKQIVHFKLLQNERESFGNEVDDQTGTKASMG